MSSTCTRWRHLLVHFLIHVQGNTKEEFEIPNCLTTSGTVKRKHHYFGASSLISLRSHLQGIWTLVRVCSGSRGYLGQHSHCSIPRIQLQNPSPQTRRSEWCHRSTARRTLLRNSLTSAKQSGGERKSVNTKLLQVTKVFQPQQIT